MSVIPYLSHGATAPVKPKTPVKSDTGYLGYIAQILGMMPNPNDPSFQPRSEKDIRARAGADMAAILDPYRAKAESAYQARSAQGTEAIKGYTDFFTDRLAQVPGQVRSAYANQRAGTAAVGDALSDYQGSAGAAGVGSLEQALRAIGAPDVEGTVAQQGQLAQNNAGTTRALSAAELDRMSNQGTAQEAFAAQMPGIGVLHGGQTLSGYLAGIGASRDEAIAGIDAQAPGLAQNLFQTYYAENADRAKTRADVQGNRAQLASSLYQGMTDQELKKQIAEAGFNVDWAHLDTTMRGQNLDFEAALSSITGANQRAANTLAAKGNAPLTQSQRNTVLNGALKQAQTLYNGPPGAVGGWMVGGDKEALLSAAGLGAVNGIRGRAFNKVYAMLASRLPGESQATLRQRTEQILQQAGYPPKQTRG